MEWLESLTAGQWLILGLVLLAIEVGLGLAYLLGVGLAAIVVAAVLTIVPLSPLAQFTLFGVGSIIATFAYARFFKNNGTESAADGLHDRLRGMIGKETRLSADLSGSSRIPFGDTLWRVQVARPVSAGNKVRVVDVQDDILLVEEIAGE